MSLREELTLQLVNLCYTTIKQQDIEKTGKAIDMTVEEITTSFEKIIDAKINRFLKAFPIDIKQVRLMDGRLIDELPGEVAYLKALVDVCQMLNNKK